ncbi:MAG: hypothetical protein C0429_18280 [Sphingopyxis sp.]|nr:hypothetical protein [Sphingopyxis sp.]
MHEVNAHDSSHVNDPIKGDRKPLWNSDGVIAHGDLNVAVIASMAIEDRSHVNEPECQPMSAMIAQCVSVIDPTPLRASKVGRGAIEALWGPHGPPMTCEEAFAPGSSLLTRSFPDPHI